MFDECTCSEPLERYAREGNATTSMLKKISTLLCLGNITCKTHDLVSSTPPHFNSLSAKCLIAPRGTHARWKGPVHVLNQSSLPSVTVEPRMYCTSAERRPMRSYLGSLASLSEGVAFNNSVFAQFSSGARVHIASRRYSCPMPSPISGRRS